MIMESKTIILHEKNISAQSKDFLSLSLKTDVKYHTCQSGDILQLSYMEYDSTDPVTGCDNYNVVSTEYFSPSNVEVALITFHYRHSNPLGARQDSGLGQDICDILGEVE